MPIYQTYAKSQLKFYSKYKYIQNLTSHKEDTGTCTPDSGIVKKHFLFCGKIDHIKQDTQAQLKI